MTSANLELPAARRVQIPEPAARCASVIRRVAVLLFENCSFIVTVVLGEIFQAANESAVYANLNVRYDLRFLSATGGNVKCSSSICVWTDEINASHRPGLDALFVSDGAGVAAAAAACDERLVQWLRRTHANMIPVVPLGEGRRLFQAACGSAERQPAGSGDDVCGAQGVEERDHTNVRLELMKGALILIARDMGEDCARGVAEHVMPETLPALSSLLGGQPDSGSVDRVHIAARWMKENCQSSISIEDAARLVDMSTRNFQRCFKSEVGVTPSAYLLHARFSIICSLLTHSELPVDKIARRTGMGNGDRLAKVFRRHLHLSPTEYRTRARRVAGI
ncbi:MULTISPECIES: helix-turn-helix domain-containing protein [Paraburkholderia]|uniref:AraC family transcriptional regulator n=1 Tax=Paraburkholderia largidicola TaxID=3014751 RepID=A0A7I8BVP3_9BURK|nr:MULTISPECIES: helix-turn-helix domain-containing protein [Paraburkholderia]BCF92876.1 AraC family transcriptional regulator [Paraburkholderia sp. PGU16]BEU26045.1 helix-turn-helix domain-containing protein [Paraburkholderia sp. 22B1P]CAG9259059.1 Transcriptional regulator, AraC family [Paraburkholderia caribensis]